MLNTRVTWKWDTPAGGEEGGEDRCGQLRPSKQPKEAQAEAWVSEPKTASTQEQEVGDGGRKSDAAACKRPKEEEHEGEWRHRQGRNCLREAVQ